MAPIYLNRSYGTPRNNDNATYVKSATGPLPVEYFDLYDDNESSDVDEPIEHHVIDVDEDHLSSDEETENLSDEESDEESDGETDDDSTVNSDEETEDDSTVNSDEEETNDEETENYPYTNQIKNQLNTMKYAIGSDERNHLVYQSEICGLVEDIGHSVDRIMNTNGRIHGHDAVRWLETLNRCRCCERHIEMRKRIECRYVQDCDCECSSIYEDISDLLVRNND